MTENAQRTPMEVKEWRARVSDGEAPSDVLLHKEYTANFKSLSEDQPQERLVDFILNTGKADRYNDVVAGEGWDIENYMKNPVVLWHHNQSALAGPGVMPHAGLPVGRGKDLEIIGESLVGTAEFYKETGDDPSEAAKFIETVYQMVDGGFLNAVSVGFAPKEYTYDEDRGGYNFISQELLEFSVVPIPADSDALRRAVQKGIDVGPIREWAIKTLDSGVDIVVPRKKLEAIVKGLGFGRGLKFFDLDAAEIKAVTKGRVKTDPEYVEKLEAQLEDEKEGFEQMAEMLQTANAQIDHLEECVQELAKGVIADEMPEKAMESGSTILPSTESVEFDNGDDITIGNVTGSDTVTWTGEPVIRTIDDLAEWLFEDIEDEVQTVEEIVEQRQAGAEDQDEDGVVVLRVLPDEEEKQGDDEEVVLRLNPEELRSAIDEIARKKLDGIESAFTKVTGQVL